MRVSTIDVGSNTVRLLVADVVGATSWQVVEQHQTVTRLGEGLATAGTLGESPMARTVAVVSEYVARAERLAAERVRVGRVDLGPGQRRRHRVGRTRQVEIGCHPVNLPVHHSTGRWAGRVPVGDTAYFWRR